MLLRRNSQDEACFMVASLSVLVIGKNTSFVLLITVKGQYLNNRKDGPRSRNVLEGDLLLGVFNAKQSALSLGLYFMDPQSEDQADYEAYLNSFYAQPEAEHTVATHHTEAGPFMTVPALSPVPSIASKRPSVQEEAPLEASALDQQEVASVFLEWTFDEPDSEKNVWRDEEGNLKAASMPKVIAKLTLDAGELGIVTYLFYFRSCFYEAIFAHVPLLYSEWKGV